MNVIQLFRCINTIGGVVRMSGGRGGNGRGKYGKCCPVRYIPTTMEQISIKTPNPKCRLYWCLIVNRDYRPEIQSVMLVFSSPLVNYSAPLTFSLVHLLVYWCKGCLNIPVVRLGKNIKSNFLCQLLLIILF
jgi:hypothetical protein